MYGVETFRSFVNGWYDGDLQDVIFFEHKDPVIRRMICSVLAGYAWDAKNPYTGPQSARRLRALADTVRASSMRTARGQAVWCVASRCWRSARARAHLAANLLQRCGRWCRPHRSASDRVVNQVVRGAFGARELTFNCVVTVKDGAMTLVGLNSRGRAAFHRSL